MVDALGNLIGFVLSEGNAADITHAQPLLSVLTITRSVVNGDKGYDSKDFVEWLKAKGAIPNIPRRSNNKEQREYDWWLYKERT